MKQDRDHLNALWGLGEDSAEETVCDLPASRIRGASLEGRLWFADTVLTASPLLMHPAFAFCR